MILPAGAALSEAILSVNVGSSTIKFALYPIVYGQVGPARFSGLFDSLQPGGVPRFSWHNHRHRWQEPLFCGNADPFDAALRRLGSLLREEQGGLTLLAVAHRVVHGGTRFQGPALVTDELLTELASFNPLAPLHQPHNLAGIERFRSFYRDLPQVACFDTAFHATLPESEYRLPLPDMLYRAGVRRYGFHGLSYQFVRDALTALTTRVRGRLLMAHLGSGASLCAARAGRSVATTMGFSTLDGLMMGSRSGALDPGVLLYLMEQGWNTERVSHLLYQECGLKGVSGLSADMRVLRESDDPAARLAIDLFTTRVIHEAGAMAAVLGGLDLLAFTGGIGEHDALLRRAVCQQLGFLGVELDEEANEAARGEEIKAIHRTQSPVEVWVVPTDEGRVAAREALRLVRGPA